MSHRYFNPHWWSLRLLSSMHSVVPDKILFDLIGRTSKFSPEPEVNSLAELVDPQKTAIDVGAAYGLYAWNLSRISRRCVAFEANPESARRLAKGLPNTEVHACALSDHEGNATLRIPRNGTLNLTGWATIEKTFKEQFDDWAEVDVPVRKLDSFGIENVGFIKIDVEGHELAVLNGASETISRDHPVLLIEISHVSQGTVDEHPIVAWLAEKGYSRCSFSCSNQNFLFKV